MTAVMGSVGGGEASVWRGAVLPMLVQTSNTLRLVISRPQDATKLCSSTNNSTSVNTCTNVIVLPVVLYFGYFVSGQGWTSYFGHEEMYSKLLVVLAAQI